MTSAVEQFRGAIAAAGLNPPDSIIGDGKLRRFASSGKRGDDSGWYVLHDDGIPAGTFGCWRTGLSQSWRADVGRSLTAVEQAAHREKVESAMREREAAEARRRADAAEKALDLLEASQPAGTDHPYLVRKGIAPLAGVPEIGLAAAAQILGYVPQQKGQALEGRALVVPVKSGAQIVSAELIDEKGRKAGIYGGQRRGGYFGIGTIEELKRTNTLCIAEGVATAATIYTATGFPTVAAFNADNLGPVAQAYRERYPAARIVICADDDYRTDGNPGVTKATDAAKETRAGLAVPTFGPNRPDGATDFNDLANSSGVQFVREQITRTLEERGDETTAAKAGKHAEEPGGDAADLLDEVASFLGRFVAYPSDYARVAHTLWVAHTHLMEVWESTPRIAFLSPEPGSGKTRALEITETLVPRPIETVNATSAAIFRKVSDPDGAPTLLWDEIDTLFGPKAKENEDIRGLLNAGHRKGATSLRCVIRGKEIGVEEMPAYCAVAIAGLGALPDTILTRSVVVRMRRRGPGEVVEPYRRRVHSPDGNALRDRLAAWALQVADALRGAWPQMPEGIVDRDADVWEALLAVADAAGGTWPEHARAAAVALVTDGKQRSPSLGVRLLADLKAIFGDRDSVATEEIIKALGSLPEAPWGDLRGKPLDARRLASLLRPYSVSSKNIRDGSGVMKGYSREDLHDPWSRYLQPGPAPAAECATDATAATESEMEGAE